MDIVQLMRTRDTAPPPLGTRPGDPSTAADLEPCPFCGSRMVYFGYTGSAAFFHPDKDDKAAACPLAGRHCGAEHWEAWNRRVGTPPLAPIATAFRDGRDLILYSPDAAEPRMFVGYWSKESSAWLSSWTHEEIDADPTHWSPPPALPAAPSGGEA